MLIETSRVDSCPFDGSWCTCERLAVAVPDWESKKRNGGRSSLKSIVGVCAFGVRLCVTKTGESGGVLKDLYV